jgi:hypothetical protein
MCGFVTQVVAYSDVEQQGCKKVRDTMMYSHGHTSLSIESNALIDIPGVFVNNSGEAELQAVLKDCTFSANHNFF